MTDIERGTPKLDVTDPAELLSYIPYHLGFQPQDSFVFLTVRKDADDGHPLGLGVVTRGDIASFGDSHTGPCLRNHIQGQLEHQGEQDVYVAVYHDAFFSSFGTSPVIPESAGPEVAKIAGELRWWLGHSGFSPARTYLVSNTAWRCLMCAFAGHCSRVGHRREDLSVTRIAASMVLKGRQVARSRDELVPPLDGASTETVSARVHEEASWLADHGPVARSVGWQSVMATRWSGAISRARRPVDPGQQREETPEELAQLALGLHSLAVRDSVIHAVCMEEDVLDPQQVSDERFARMFDPSEVTVPIRIQGCLDLFAEVARFCPPEGRAPILAVWAWCHWWIGEGAKAAVLLERVRAVDPDYSLGETLASVLHARLRPPWITAAWESGA